MLSVTNLVASHHTTAAHHPWTTTPIIHCTTTHTFPSTIAPITQLSPITNQAWLSCHTCTSFTHPHISSTLPYTRCEVLFCPVWHSERFPCILLPCVYLDCLTTLIICCLPSWPYLPCDILSVCRLPRPLHCPCCWFCLAFIAPVTAFDLCLFDLLLSVIKLQLDLTSLPLRYRRLRHLRSSGFISATQPNHGSGRPTPTSSPGRPVHWGVCSPVLWAVISGTVVRWISIQGHVSFRPQ